ncbi:MAG: N-acetyltransferase [Leptolyngbyaceae cyanobacterium SL_7_1]|nr:N-acetyltransferase [Leptolyngbyaceae cyanobacterium SL_7_1]
MTIKIRSEISSDRATIRALTTNAFLNVPHSSHTEQLIVDALRDSGNLTISLVAESNGEIVGHVAISPVTISDGSQGWYGLGPISVAPNYQGIGIGSHLMKQALASLREMGAAGCVLLGNPKYYGRFGFKAEASLVLPGVSPEYFQAIAFGNQIPSGFVSFHESFHV